MIQPLVLVDRPYLSAHVRELIERHELPVVLTPAARALGVRPAGHTLSETEAAAAARAADRVLVYTSSENALPWVAEHLHETHLPRLAALFKDKGRFRRALRPRYPDFYFREVPLAELDSVDGDRLPYPLVIKPSVGFFSHGVVTVPRPRDWPGARRAIRRRLEAARALYPPEVLGTRTLLIEQYLEGREYAVDAYYDARGEPVVLGIWSHAFASDTDTSDRVYSTSADIVAENLAPCREVLRTIGQLTGARDMPVHLEVRRTPDGDTVPIELNPLRFGGWCSTADLTPHAWGFSPYLHFLQQRSPDWPALIEAAAGGPRYSIVVLDNSTGMDGNDIAAFHYDALLRRFHRPLELRRVDWREQPLFGFLFLETPAEAAAELEWALRSDLREFATPR